VTGTPRPKPVGQNEVLERLYRLAPRGALLGLERMRAACAQYRHPERAAETLHIAGTNGKGSVAAMTAAIARAERRRAGLYTSPHLCRFHERIQVDGRPVADEVLYPVLADVLERCPDLTFFETATLVALVIFAQLEVDVAILEVGLGGRLDATNVLERPRACAITRIALDHTDRLGMDLGSIAREKAGIIKPHVPVVVGPLSPEALGEVESLARTANARVIRTDTDLELASFVARHPPALEGAHQVDNAKVAVGLAREVGWSEAAMAIGLAAVRWPGRLEHIATPDGEVLLDAAHNPDGAAALAAALQAHQSPGKVALVFGAMADKDHAGMLAVLAPVAAKRVYIAPDGRRPADPAQLAVTLEGDVAATVEEALELGRRAAGPDGLVVVTGSIFLVGAARALLLGLARDPAVAL
jgi:dihydrofolate synthase/folylpolyglutamate synthase